jgi:hypothetical protein
MPSPSDILSDPEISKAYEDVRSDKSETTWLILKVRLPTFFVDLVLACPCSKRRKVVQTFEFWKGVLSSQNYSTFPTASTVSTFSTFLPHPKEKRKEI